MSAHPGPSTPLCAARAVPLAAALLAAALLTPASSAQEPDPAGAWKASITAGTSGGKTEKFSVTVYLSRSGDEVTGLIAQKLGKCGLQLTPLHGFASAGAFDFTALVPDISPECSVQCESPLQVEMLLQDGTHATGDGTIMPCMPDPGQPAVQPLSLQMTKVSGMQSPTDPDGAGPGVPVDQIGSGEPGSGGAHDLAVTSLKAPAKVTLSSKKPVVTGKVKVRIQNRGQHAELIEDFDTLQGLVHLDVDVPANMSATAQDAGDGPVLDVQLVQPKQFPILLAPRKQLTLTFLVSYDHAIDPAASTKTESHADFRCIARVDHGALPGALADDHLADDQAPRRVAPPFDFDSYPDGKIKDKGVGAKLPDGTLGGDVLTDVIVK